ncbi:hypothetical protein GGI42DRAFT_108935 [Trichoderma sp. SZMC 28013]
MKQQSNPSKCSTNAIGYCARLSSGAIISPSKTREIHSPRRSVLFDGLSALTHVSFRQNNIQKPIATCWVLGQGQLGYGVSPHRFLSSSPLMAFLVATHITEVEGAASVYRPLTEREDYHCRGGSPQESNIAERDCQKARRLIEHRKRASVSSARQIL